MGPAPTPATDCYVRLPTGCSRELWETTAPNVWFVDPHSTNSSRCTARKQTFNDHCRRSNAEAQWGIAAPPLTPPPTLAETLLLGAPNTNACPENSYPLSEEGCDQANGILKKPYHPYTYRQGPQGGWPSGCFLQTYNDAVMWNPHFPGSYTGGSSQYGRPICTTAATLAAPTPDP